MAFDGAELIAFASQKAMAARLGDLVALALGEAIAARGTATIALSGGTTPAALYRVLSEQDVDWAKVTATLVDERWVAPGHSASNETFVRGALLTGRAADARFIGLWNDAGDLAAGVEAANERLSGVARPLDVVILGMGVDGHTASWFPHSDGLAAALADGAPMIVAVRAKKSDVTGDYVERATMSLEAVRSARLVILMITGDKKRSVFEKVSKTGPFEEAPVRAIIERRPDLWSVWAP